MSIFSSLKDEIECEYARIPTAFFCSVVIRLCLNPKKI